MAPGTSGTSRPTANRPASQARLTARGVAAGRCMLCQRQNVVMHGPGWTVRSYEWQHIFMDLSSPAVEICKLHVLDNMCRAREQTSQLGASGKSMCLCTLALPAHTWHAAQLTGQLVQCIGSATLQAYMGVTPERHHWEYSSAYACSRNCVQDCVGERRRGSLWGTLEIHEHAHACIGSLIAERGRCGPGCAGHL